MFKKKLMPPIPPALTAPPDLRTVEFICEKCGVIAVTRAELDASSPLSGAGVTPMSRPCGCGRLMRRAALR